MMLRSAIVVLGVLALTPVQAQPPTNGAPHFTISGTSTVRAWSCPADGSVKAVAAKASQPPMPGFPHGLQSMTVTVPIRAIACETDLMNDHLRETLKEKNAPAIVFELQQYTIDGAGAAKATGTLTIGGVTKPVSLDIRLAPAAQGVRGTGETTIDMTQFGIAPPVIFDGLLKVGKDVRVRFDATVTP